MLRTCDCYARACVVLLSLAGPSETQSAVSQMQDTCVRLLAQAGVARRSALAALVQLSPWITTQSEDSTDMPPVLNHLLPSLVCDDR